MDQTIRTVVSIATLGMLMCFGCTSSTHNPATVSATLAEIDMPPKDLLARTRQIVSSPPISLPIDSEQKGTLITGYQSFRGDWHIARHWQERTRYRIQITPDWDEPTRRSHIEIWAQTQQRAASNQTFSDAPELDRSDRAARLLSEIQSGLLAK
jgi:hypothetical protein